MTTADVGKHKALKIDPQEYIRCSELRKKVNPLFSQVLWPVDSNPTLLHVTFWLRLTTSFIWFSNERLELDLPSIAQVRIDEEQVRTQWPDAAVPAAILQGAQGMDTLHTFKPTLDGPATMKAPT